jgi:uncharacterized protein
MTKSVLFIQGAGHGAYDEDKLLASSLQSALGAEYRVQCPQMPDEENSPYDLWKAEIEAQLSALRGEVFLVGHSVGGSVLVKYVSETSPTRPLAGLFVVAAPYWGEKEGWQWDDLNLPPDIAARFAGDWPIFIYHNRDDEVVPFAHLALYSTKLPRAKIRAFDAGGHQFNNDLSAVARDIKASEESGGEESGAR